MHANIAHTIVAFVTFALVPFSMACSSSDAAAGSCSDACAKSVAANCKAGATQAQCEQQCNNPRPVASECNALYGAAIDCQKKATSFTCDAEGVPHAVGCDDQLQAVVTCLASQHGDGGPSGH